MRGVRGLAAQHRLIKRKIEKSCQPDREMRPASLRRLLASEGVLTVCSTDVRITPIIHMEPAECKHTRLHSVSIQLQRRRRGSRHKGGGHSVFIYAEGPLERRSRSHP